MTTKNYPSFDILKGCKLVGMLLELHIDRNRRKRESRGQWLSGVRRNMYRVKGRTEQETVENKKNLEMQGNYYEFVYYKENLKKSNIDKNFHKLRNRQDKALEINFMTIPYFVTSKTALLAEK